MKIVIENDDIIEVQFIQEQVGLNDLRMLEEAIEVVHKTGEKVNIMVYVPELKSATKNAIMESFKFCFNERKNIHKIAVVSHKEWYRYGVAFENCLVSWKEKYFDINNIENARKWLKS